MLPKYSELTQTLWAVVNTNKLSKLRQEIRVSKERIKRSPSKKGDIYLIPVHKKIPNKDSNSIRIFSFMTYNLLLAHTNPENRKE
jgi:hypothetical protein